jgi:RNA polymerase sigma factor (TIGR02999 family)
MPSRPLSSSDASGPSSGPPLPADEASMRELYDELRQLAAARMAGEAAGHTLQPTALVHEAWLRLAGPDGIHARWTDRSHFFRVAALTMRRVLVDHARRHATSKRGAGADHIPFDGLDLPFSATDQNSRVVLIDEALSRLEQEDADAARVVTLRFFGGFTNREIAAALEVTERTVERQWAYARARLMQLIQEVA